MKLREADVQKTILDGLAAMHIWAVRMNSGAMFGSHKGKSWAVRFGRKGMADILALNRFYDPHSMRFSVWAFRPLWIECKLPGQKQSPEQVAFQAEVESEGHKYVIANSWEDVLAVLE